MLFVAHNLIDSFFDVRTTAFQFNLNKGKTVNQQSNIIAIYIFAYNRDFLVYNNDANRYIRYYKNTFQHGGISMEEMIVPYVVLNPKMR